MSIPKGTTSTESSTRELVELLDELGFEDVILFNNPEYETALIGVTVSDEASRAVYDYDKMVECLMSAEDMTEEDAVDWIEYNTIRSIPYIGKNAPVITIKL